MRTLAAAAAAVTAALATPAAVSAATLTVEPVERCYREQQTVFLTAQGYTPSGFVEFTRDGVLIDRLQADANGTISGNLTLRGLLSGQRVLTYMGTDVTNPAITAQVSLLTTATDVTVRPVSGPPHRLMRIRGRGFFGRPAVWAHIVRLGGGARASAVRNVRIGRVRGPCRKVKAKRRLFRRGAAPGRYQVQFDGFRRYRRNREIEYDALLVRIFRTG
jgi:hypothetical protein